MLRDNLRNARAFTPGPVSLGRDGVHPSKIWGEGLWKRSYLPLLNLRLGTGNELAEEHDSEQCVLLS